MSDVARAERREFWTVPELARRWRCSPQTVLNMIHEADESRRLPAMPLRGGFRVHESAVAARENAAMPPKAKAAVSKRRRHVAVKGVIDHFADVPDL